MKSDLRVVGSGTGMYAGGVKIRLLLFLFFNHAQPVVVENATRHYVVGYV